MRAASAVLLISACSGSHVVAVIPSDAAVTTWMAVLFDGATTHVQVIGPGQPLEVEVPMIDGVTLEAIGFAESNGLVPGPLVVATEGAMFPDRAASYRADVASSTWSRTDAPSERTLALRLPRSDDCLRFVSKTEQLTESASSLGVRGMIDIDPDARLLITGDAFYRATADTLEPIPLALAGIRASTVGADGVIYVTTSTAVFTLANAGGTWTATHAWEFTPQVRLPFTIVAPRAGLLYGIDEIGQLFRSEKTGTRVLHQFEFTTAHHERGKIIIDGDKIVAGVGPDPTLVELDANDNIRRLTLPSPSEGAVSVTRFGDLGLLVGTNAGNLRAESLGFEVIPDPLDQLPKQVQIRTLFPVGDRLFFAGNSGVFGQLTAGGFVCTSELHAGSSVRYMSMLDDQILAAGGTFENGRSDVNITRFTIQP